MYIKTSNNLTFKVRRQKPELISPAKPTPHEFKTISDIDDQQELRMQVPMILIYQKEPTMGTNDPVNVIRNAIAKTLVYYYPLAGRLREGYQAQKLVVECNGEGIMFIEADADVTLEEFGDALYPPFACFDEILYEAPNSGGLVNCPLLLIQVTRLKCGGFIFALRFNHIMIDTIGIMQFIYNVGKIARGAESPSVQPLWERHLLDGQRAPSVTNAERDRKGYSIPLDNMVHNSFVFSKTDISTIRRSLPPRLQSCSTFELLTACLWQCRTIAMAPYIDEESILISVTDVRRRFNPPLPRGYYGNALVFPVAICKSKDLCEKPLEYAVDLVKEMKSSVTSEYVKSYLNQPVINKVPVHTEIQSYIVSDVTQVVLPNADFGWGKQFYGGIEKGDLGTNPCGVCLYIHFANKRENEIVVPICLPQDAMEVFVKELKSILEKDGATKAPRMSAL